jgi:PAS domain S-box-containing protein
MSSRQQRIQTLYEISLAIRSRETLEETADQALAAYLQKLNCSVGAVFRITPTADAGELSLAASIPANPERNELFCRARDRLGTLVQASEMQPASSDAGTRVRQQNSATETTQQASAQYTFEEPLPVAERVDDTGEYHLMELPGFGVLLLGKRGGTIDPRTVSSLTPPNEKLAQACRSTLTERQLREQRDRFEAVFAAIPEPVVNVVVENGTERIVRANKAFQETFVGDERSIRGQDLNELVVPDGQSANTEGLVEALNRGRPLESELKRNTISGNRHFLFSGVPVTAGEKAEYFGVYVDITEQKQRQQTLEKLYDAAQELLGERSRQEVCTHAVEVIESVLEYPAVSIHLYQRASEALEPVAVSEQAREKLENEPAGYTDRETIVWRAYENREPVRLDDTRQFEGTFQSEDSSIKSVLVLPIGRHGVLITSASEPNAFDDRDMYFLRLLSQSVEIALDRATSEDGLRTIQRAVRDALRADTHEEMAERVLEDLPDVLDLPVAGIWKYQPASQQLQPVRQTEQAAELVGDQPVLSKGKSLAWEAFAEGTTSVVPDASDLDGAHNSKTPIKGEVSVPVGDFGVLTAGSTHKDSFTELDAEILQVLGTNLEAIAEVIDTRQDIDLLDQVIARILRHNVRNTLTPISGYASKIVEEAAEPISGYARRIVDDCEKLEQTAAHARKMRKVVQNRDQITTVSLGTTVRSAAASIDEEFTDGKLVSRIAETPDVTAHPELETAIRHLIRNGFEHNNSDTPRVEVVVEQLPNGPTVSVIDNGPGIDTYELDTLDEHGESALEHGSGVGLWIVDRIVNYSEALLEFETDTTGTTAEITFPSHADVATGG